MALLTSFPLFYANADQKVSATDLNRIRENIGLIDRWSYRVDQAFDSSAGLDTNTPGYYQSGNPMRIWWGAGRYIAGCTTLTVEGFGVKSSAENLKVYINGTDVSGSGTLVMTITLPTGTPAAFSGTWTVSGLTDGDIVTCEIRAEGVHLTNATGYEIKEVYFSPVTKSGWTAATGFTLGTLNATKFNQLCDSAYWVYQRMRMVPLVARLGLFYNLGPFKDSDPQHTDRPMYYGSIGKYYSNAILRIGGSVTSLTTEAWNFKVYLNGTLAYTSSTYGLGTQSLYIPLSLTSYTIGTRIRVKITASALTGGSSDPLRFTRWSFPIMRAEPDGSGWPYATLPAAFEAWPTLTSSDDLVTALNGLVTIVNNAKTRIDGRTELWGRSRFMRRYFNRDDSVGQQQARARPYFPRRVGNELYVKGEGVELQWGLLTPGKLDEQANGFEGYAYSQKQTADQSATGQLIYLDDLPGLDIGTAFALFGNPYYAAEYLA